MFAPNPVATPVNPGDSLPAPSTDSPHDAGSWLTKIADRYALEGASTNPTRTRLSLERTYLAAERTLQAWIRTSLSLISFGFTIGKLGQMVITLPGVPRDLSTNGLAYMLVVLGTLALAGATFQHWLTARSLRLRGLRRKPSLASIVALLLTLFGMFAFSALVLNL